MPTPKPKTVRTPFEQKQTSTYAPQSIAGTPEAQAFLDVPLDFNADPGAGRRADLAEQEATNRWDSAFMMGVPSFIREALRGRELREIRSQGAHDVAAADADARNKKTMTELERRRLLLPQIMQTGGQSSGFNTQAFAPQPGFLQNLAVGFASGLGSNPKI